MDFGCVDCRLASFLLLATLTFLCELTSQGVFLYHLYREAGAVWCWTCTTVVLLSLVASQLVSYQLRSEHNKDTQERRWVFVLCHVTLAGLLWRYGRLARSCRIAITRREIWEAFVVRVFLTFSGSLPLLCLSTYLMFLNGFDSDTLRANLPVVVCVLTTLLSVLFALITYAKLSRICCVIGSLPPSGDLMWKVPWRLCDVVARVLSVVVFALVHSYWVLLVLLLHWITMSLLLILDNNIKDKSNKAKLAFDIFISSYIHVFLRFNTASGKSKLVLILYYVISGAECVTLTVLWFLYNNRTELNLPIGVTIGISLVGSILCAVGYYGCLHQKSLGPEVADDGDTVCFYQCMACRLQQLGRKTQPYTPSHVSVQENPNPQFCDLLQPSEYTRRDGRCPQTQGPTRKNSNYKPVRRAASLCQTGYTRDLNTSAGPILCDLSWDEAFDIAAYSDTTDYSTIHRRGYHSSSDDSGSTDCECSSARERELQEITDKLVPLTQGLTRHRDGGYYSGISSASSSNNNNQQTSGDTSRNASHKIPLFPNTCNGFWSDDGSSTVTSVSSRVRLMSRDTRYYDTTSLDSYTPSTAHHSNIEPILNIPTHLKHLNKHKGHPGSRRNHRSRPKKRIYHENPGYNGDISSTHVPDVESEIDT